MWCPGECHDVRRREQEMGAQRVVARSVQGPDLPTHRQQHLPGRRKKTCRP